MADRLELQTLFEELQGTGNVYFQPPTGFKMEYPAIVYTRKTWDERFADNSAYIRSSCYEVTVIDPDPDGELALKVKELPHCRHDRNFKADNLNHDVFTLYF